MLTSSNRTRSRRRGRPGAASSRRSTAPTSNPIAGQALATIAPGPTRTAPRSIDLAEDLADDPRGQLSTWRVVGRAEPIEVLYYAGTWNNPGRGGVDEGSGARWTDAASPRDALVRYLTGRIL